MKDIQYIITTQLQAVGEGCHRSREPEGPVFDAVQYSSGYTVPKFKMFTGEGPKMVSPDQHFAHFIATCGNTAGNEALLLRQFPQSLGGAVVLLIGKR
jgi:hypothetical protein